MNPLQQFSVRDIAPLRIGDIDFSITNSSLSMVLVLLIAVVLCFFALRRSQKISTNGGELELNRASIAGEMLYEMISNMTLGTAGRKAVAFVGLVFTIFIFILLCNLLGMFPCSFAVTGQLSVTFALAAAMFIGVTLVGFIKHGWGYLSLFVPPGVPLVLSPLLFIIELFAYLARPVTLSLRLTTNIVAGHIILKTIATLAIMGGILGIAPFGLLVVLTGFEIFIAVLQAYIFSILVCVYLGDALDPKH